MKMNSLIGLLIILALLLTACNITTVSPSTTVATQATTIPATGTTDKNPQNTTPTTTAAEPSPSIDPSGDMGDAPIGLVFESFDDIQAFQVASMGTSAEYLNYLDTANLSMNIPQNVAQKFAMFLSSQQYPTQIGTNTQTDFGGVYYLDRNVLDLTIKTNSIRYRFIYYFGQDPELAFIGAPVVNDLDLGTAEIDLYQSDGGLIGSYSNQFAVVQVIVYTDEPEAVLTDSIVFSTVQ